LLRLSSEVPQVQQKEFAIALSQFDRNAMARKLELGSGRMEARFQIDEHIAAQEKRRVSRYDSDAQEATTAANADWQKSGLRGGQPTSVAISECHLDRQHLNDQSKLGVLPEPVLQRLIADHVVAAARVDGGPPHFRGGTQIPGETHRISLPNGGQRRFHHPVQVAAAT
jgi:hypothetical protein